MSEMDQANNSDIAQGQQGALFALIEVSQDRDIASDYRTIASAFDEDDYRTIIDLAWRHQFNDERLNFKRQIRELQQHVCSRIPITGESAQ
jgi:hypothetical protein